MPWPFRRRKNADPPAAVPAAGEAASGVGTAVLEPPEPPRYARAAPGAWRKLPPMVTASAPPPRTAVTEVFISSLATRQQVIHHSPVPRRSADAPAGLLLATPVDLPARRAARSREMPPLAGSAAEVPPPVRQARPARAPLPSFAIDELPPLPPVKVVPLPRPADEAYEFDPDELGPDGVLESWSLTDNAPEDVRQQLGLVEVPAPEPPPPPPTLTSRRPNLGQSRRLGLGQPVTLPEEHLRRLRAGEQVHMPPETFADELDEPAADAMFEPVVEPVPEDLRRLVLDAHGVDVGDVPIVRGPDADRAARELGARAFAADDAVFLPDAAGSLDHPEGRALAAHELVHIAQQRMLGTNLPDEASDAGAELESDARLAEAHVRGDGAPRPGSAEAARLQVVQPLLTGVARLDDDGNLVYAPAARTPLQVQRAVDLGAPPSYAWQLDVLREAGTGNSPLRSQAGDLLDRPAGEVPEDLGAGLEEAHLDDLVEYRRGRRDDLVQRAGFTFDDLRRPASDDIGPPGLLEPSSSPDDLGQLEATMGAANAALEALRNRYARSYERWVVAANAVDEVVHTYPLRDEDADRVDLGSPPVFDSGQYEAIRSRAVEAGARILALQQAQTGGSAELVLRTTRAQPRESPASAELIEEDRQRTIEETARAVQDQLGPVDQLLRRQGEAASPAERPAATPWPETLEAAAARSGAPQPITPEHLANLGPEERRVWERENIEALRERRREVFEEATETAVDVMVRQRQVQDGTDIRGLTRNQQLALLSDDEWGAILRRVAAEVPLVDERLDPLSELIPDEVIVLRLQLARETVLEPRETPAVELPAPATQGGPETVAPAAAREAEPALRASSLDLQDLEQDQLDVLARRLWFFMRSRLRTELLVDRERAGMLSDFYR